MPDRLGPPPAAEGVQCVRAASGSNLLGNLGVGELEQYFVVLFVLLLSQKVQRTYFTRILGRIYHIAG